MAVCHYSNIRPGFSDYQFVNDAKLFALDVFHVIAKATANAIKPAQPIIK